MKELASTDPRVERGLPEEIESKLSLWEQQVLEVRGKSGIDTRQDQQEVVLECANSVLPLIAAVHVRRDELKLGISLEGDGFLISGAGFIVQDLEVDIKATGCQPCHDGIVGGNAVVVIPGLEGLLENEVAIGMVGDHHILVAKARLDRETTCVVCVEPAEGVDLDEDLIGR